MKKEKYLVINAGSSSLKFSLYEMPDKKEIVNGLVERIGKQDSSYTLKYNNIKEEKKSYIADHNSAVSIMISELLEKKLINNLEEIKGIGHRVLHGGEIYSSSVLIDNKVLNDIKSLTKLGPLHHPGEIAGIESLMTALPAVPQIAVFDTAFHQTMPQENYLYAVPYSWYIENGVRKYGFHGTSHNYITGEMQKYYDRKDVNLIVCHIGSGASISAIKNGECYDTTMGLTPLDGLIMGTRSGSIDPSILEYISKERNLTISKVNECLNKESGLLGIAGYNDFRDIESNLKNGDKRATLAYNMFRNSIIKYIAQYYFELEGNVDAIVFTAGVGENAIGLREDIINKIGKIIGVILNKEANNNIAKFKPNKTGKISLDGSNTDVFVIPTNEELMILKDTYNISNNRTNNKVLNLKK